MEEVTLQIVAIEQLSYRGITAYLAVELAGDIEATTADLARRVKCQPTIMLEGLKELASVFPKIVSSAGKGRWQCGDVPFGLAVQISDPGESNRYKDFVDDLKLYWDHVNQKKLPFAFSAKDGAACRRFLTDYYTWERVHWRTALQARSKSVVSKSAPFFTWVPKLAEYGSGALNEFNKPQEGTGKHGQAVGVEAGNRAAREAVRRGNKG